MGPKKVSAKCSAEKKKRMMSLTIKHAIVEQHERGVRVVDLWAVVLQSVQSEQLRQAGAEKKKGNRGQSSTASAAKAKVLRETKPIPNLIFSIEQYERFLIQLSKKAKVNLMQYMKLSTSRDFRINAASLQEPQPQQEEGTQDDEEGKGVCERTSSQTSDTQRAGTSTSGVGRAGTQQTSMKPKVAVVQRGGQAPPKKRRKI
uniref:uncharacterized protein n=1 Tax=Myxine glutinosa TaxID=7769 RepID=UPI00358EB336